MALDYFTLYSHQTEFLEPLSLEERGELLTAICAYAFDGVINELHTNARFVFPVFKTAVDKCEAKAKAQKANGSKGGRPKANKTQVNPIKPNENPTQTQRIYKDKDKETDIDKDKDIISFGDKYAADDELIQKQEEQNQVLDAAHRAGMGKNDSERFKLIDLYTQYGVDKVISGIDECVTHGVTTIAYLKAVLEGKPKSKPAGKVVEAQKFTQREWSNDTSDMDAMMREVR